MGNAQMGQRDGFSAFDIEKLNKMYDCGYDAPSVPAPAPTPAPTPITPPVTGGQGVDNNVIDSFVSGILTGLGLGDQPNA